MKGWYPDPGGAPGRYRWFDGRTWSGVTTDDPRARPPRAARGHLLASPARSLLLITAVTLVGLSVIWLGIRWVDQRGGPPLAPAPAAPTPVPLVIGRPCTGGAPETRLPHPTDGRVHGGGLSYPAAERFALAAPEKRLTFAWDVQQQVNTVDLDPEWLAQLVVAELRPAAGFTGTARAVAERVLSCLLASELYDRSTLRPSVVASEARTVSGRPGWIATAEVGIDVPNLDFPGERIVVVVVPDGEAWGMFLSAVPLGNTDLLTAADRAADGLAAA